MDVQRVVSYRHFCNKVWNAVRYALPLLKTTNDDDAKDAKLFTPTDLSLLRGDMTLADRWIMSRLVSLVMSSCYTQNQVADHKFM